jgi:hypothetical protein
MFVSGEHQKLDEDFLSRSLGAMEGAARGLLFNHLAILFGLLLQTPAGWPVYSKRRPTPPFLFVFQRRG